jgi:CDP-paratose 2-epimerase
VRASCPLELYKLNAQQLTRGLALLNPYASGFFVIWQKFKSYPCLVYYSDLTKMREHYPDWDITISLEETIKQIVESWQQRLNTGDKLLCS